MPRNAGGHPPAAGRNTHHPTFFIGCFNRSSAAMQGIQICLPKPLRRRGFAGAQSQRLAITRLLQTSSEGGDFCNEASLLHYTYEWICFTFERIRITGTDLRIILFPVDELCSFLCVIF